MYTAAEAKKISRAALQKKRMARLRAESMSYARYTGHERVAGITAQSGTQARPGISLLAIRSTDLDRSR